MRDVAVIGVGQSRFGKFPQIDAIDLGREAVRAALKDANVSARSIQEAFAARLYVDQVTAQVLLRDVGISGIEMVNVENGSAGGGTAVRSLWKDIAFGLCDIGLAVGLESMTRSPFAGKIITPREDDLAGQLGGAIPVDFALLARRLMHTRGATAEDFAQISVKAHRAGALNPMAQYQKELTVEDVLRSRMIADPIRLFECCPATDGAAAVVLCAAELAPRFVDHGVRILASVLRSGSYDFERSDWTSFDVGKKSASAAYEMAGVGPEDLDVVELHDAFAPEELVHYEDLGLCATGECVRLLRSGDTALGGRRPVNPSGGLLSLGHPIGASGVRNIGEITLQLRGHAGARQVPGAKLGLAQMIGGQVAGMDAGACSIHILGR